MSLDPRRLLVLQAVRRTGGVLAAAHALHLTPSGVSQHLAKLEAETGLALLDRSRRGGGRTVRLTNAGRALADQAEQVAVALATAEREVDRLRSRTSGVVRIGGFASALNQLVAPVVASMALSDPAIEPQIVEVEETRGVTQLRAGELDFLLSERHPTDPVRRPRGLVEVDLARDPYRVVVPDSWPHTDRPDELLSGSWVATAPDQASRRRLERLCEDAGVTANVPHVCNDSGTMLALVAAGLGAAIIPELTLSYQPRQRVRVSTGLLDPGARILTVLRPRLTVGAPAAERFLAELQRLAATRVGDAGG